jgi:hypothetical protein
MLRKAALDEHAQQPWAEWTADELANDADTGTRGQGAVVEASRRLIVATQSAGDCASAQTAEEIKLTHALKLYTIRCRAHDQAGRVVMTLQNQRRPS